MESRVAALEREVASIKTKLPRERPDKSKPTNWKSSAPPPPPLPPVEKKPKTLLQQAIGY